ncbi:MAG: alpha/beta fold hydrolase [Myxococcota bacterium]
MKLDRVVFVWAAVLWSCGGSSVPVAQPTPRDEPIAATESEQSEAASEEAEEPTAAGTLVLEGTPEVSPALNARLNQYTNTRSASLAGVAADGGSVVMITRFAETAQLHHVASPMGARTQLTFTEEPVRGAQLVPGDPEQITFLADVGGAEDYQIFALNRASGRIAQLTDGESRHTNWVFSRDGSAVAFNNNARNGQDVDVYLAQGLNMGEARRLTSEEGHWYPIELSRDGEHLLVGHYVSINDSRVHRIHLASGEMTRLTPEEPTASYRDAAFNRDGSRVYLSTDRDGEFVELYEMDPAAPEDPWRPLSREVRWNVEAMALSPDGRTLAFTTNEDGYSVLRFLNTRSRRITVPSGIPRGLIADLTFAEEANVLGMTIRGPTLAGDSYTYDLRRRSLTRWTESEIGGLDAARFIEPTVVRYPTFDEREIPAFYYRPPGDGPFPVLVLIHGGPESQARPYFSPLTQYLASERGIAVLVPNVRGSDGYGKSYLLLDNGAQREDSVKDIGALLDWAEAREEIDASRAAVFGGSYGGYMVLASLVHFGDRLRAGVDIVGISNFVTFLENTRAYRRDLRRAEYGDERDADMRETLMRISPLTRAAEIRSALFVAHGANDPRVTVSEAEQLVEAVRGAGQSVWYMLARNEGHGFRRKENRDLFMQLTVMFLEEQLLGVQY